MTTMNVQTNTQLDRNQWLKLGLITAVTSIIAVLVVQIAAMAIWPEIALFKPLDSLARTAVFTAVPIAVATALFAWLSRHKADPVRAFLTISAVILLLSIIPDYLLPVENKTFLASSVTAFLHVVAAAVTVLVLVVSYRQQSNA